MADRRQGAWLATASVLCAALVMAGTAPWAGASPDGSRNGAAAPRRVNAWQADVEPTQPGNVAAVARDLLVRANDERAERATPPMAVDAELEAYAVRHSRRMARASRAQPHRQALSHSDDRARRAAGGSAEIVATVAAADASAEAHESVMRSAPHRAILLAGDARRVGVGVACHDERAWVTYVTDGVQDRGLPEAPVVRDDSDGRGCGDHDEAPRPRRGAGEDEQAPEQRRGAGEDPGAHRGAADPGDGKVVQRHRRQRPAGKVDDLTATRLAGSQIALTWSAVDGGGGPAGGYRVTQTLRPAEGDGGGQRRELCDGVCRFRPGSVGQRLRLTVGPLATETAYRYQVRPVDESGEAGPASNEARATTTPASLLEACPADHVTPAPFTDRGAMAPPHRDNVDCVFFRQLGSGFDDGAYQPGAVARRDHVATFLANTLAAVGVDLPAGEERRFADVDPGSPHAEAIDGLAAAGIVTGGPEGGGDDVYGPGLAVRRDQLASFLVRALEHARQTSLEAERPGRFDDVASTNVHADHIAVAAEHELTPGFDDGRYRPTAVTRRAQLATFVVRLLQAAQR